MFVAAIVAHLCRNFFTGAFRRPRELNWFVGVTLLILAVVNGFAGYSLLDDLLSGTGLRIAYSIALAVPVVGTWLAFLAFGGEFPADDILTRLFVVHIFIAPAAIAVLLTVHIALVWRQRHTQFPGPGRTEHNVVGTRFWPAHAAKSIGLFALVFAVLAALGGLVPDQPGVAPRPLRPRCGHHRRPAGLVHGVDRRGDAPRRTVGLGARPNSRCQSSSSRPSCCPPRRSECSTPGPSWNEGSPATAIAISCSNAHAIVRCGRRSGAARWRSMPSCS